MQLRPVTFTIAWCGMLLGYQAAYSEKDSAQPENSKIVENVQPDYAKWIKIKNGMTDVEVKALLGEPLEDSGKSDRVSGNLKSVRRLRYGRLRFDSPSLPEPFDFIVALLDDKVIGVRDPFGGAVPTNGRPQTPILVLPDDKAVFKYYPAVVDFRWYPTPGLYPVEYVVDIEYAVWITHPLAEAPGKGFEKAKPRIVSVPYLATLAPYAESRWRIKARNAVGESEWSDWRSFRYERWQKPPESTTEADNGRRESDFAAPAPIVPKPKGPPLSLEGLERAKKDIDAFKATFKTKSPEQLIKCFVPDGPKPFGGYEYYYKYMANIEIERELASRGKLAEPALRASTENKTPIWEAVSGPGYTVGKVCRQLLARIEKPK
jgi:hypothetical protein